MNRNSQPQSNQGFTRRSFFGTLAATGVGSAVLASGATNAVFADDAAPAEPKKIVASHPLLQNVTNDGATIAWALNGQATGWVEWGTTPDLGKVARNSELGLNPLETEFISARICGLAPNTKYYYRTATCAFSYRTAYDKTASEPEYSDVFSFETTGPAAETVSFATMNDTHSTIPTVAAALARADELKSQFVFWNGDVCPDCMNANNAKNSVASPIEAPHAAERPLVFVCGNHEKRGSWIRELPKCFTQWPQADPEFAGLGYNFAFRQGPVAFVGLDTGEDKPDWHPAWSGMANYEPYRELQAAWLDRALSKPEIADAPYLIAFTHIPLYDANPKANPGNIYDNWADYQWSACRLWAPIFEKHGVQLLIAAHQHQFSYAPATADRSWAQVVGGGPQMKNATLIYGEANADEFKLTCEKLEDKSVLGSWTFKPRQK